MITKKRISVERCLSVVFSQYFINICVIFRSCRLRLFYKLATGFSDHTSFGKMQGFLFPHGKVLYKNPQLQFINPAKQVGIKPATLLIRTVHYIIPFLYLSSNCLSVCLLCLSVCHQTPSKLLDGW